MHCLVQSGVGDMSTGLRGDTDLPGRDARGVIKGLVWRATVRSRHPFWSAWLS